LDRFAQHGPLRNVTNGSPPASWYLQSMYTTAPECISLWELIHCQRVGIYPHVIAVSTGVDNSNSNLTVPSRLGHASRVELTGELRVESRCLRDVTSPCALRLCDALQLSGFVWSATRPPAVSIEALLSSPKRWPLSHPQLPAAAPSPQTDRPRLPPSSP
jgi:hypothetical protein